ncbi:unnamed protein product [Haemonchus placei]|uniref:Endo/exonuclease/phosphatase domain-containing protein n=1 Tax=Haemonchus placei TaxID=6290 RepID=A0A0N4W1A2_HAEPC|nr:unnamed protein product [Haemonchus placei]
MANPNIEEIFVVFRQRIIRKPEITGIINLKSGTPKKAAAPCLQFSLVLFNARSLAIQLTELHHLLSLSESHAVFITETWFDEKIIDSEINSVSPYEAIRRDRGSKGGGELCVHLQDDIDVEEVL